MKELWIRPHEGNYEVKEVYTDQQETLWVGKRILHAHVIEDGVIKLNSDLWFKKSTDGTWKEMTVDEQIEISR